MAPPASLPTVKLGKTNREIPKLGFGMMGLSLAYGSVGTMEDRLAVLDRAWELGSTNWDSSDFYGDSEELIGRWFALHPERRADIFLATKFAASMTITETGEMDMRTACSPEYTRAACERSLKRLGIESIDLYYIHRLDGKTPIEVTMKTLQELKREGKIRSIGISECSATTLRRAYQIEPVEAVQVEYNPWQLDIENSVGTHLLAACRELGVTVFAYSPLGRGFLTGQIRTIDDFAPDDFRRAVPRFSPENFPKNLVLVDKFQAMAAAKGCTSGQLALAWLTAQGPDIVPIPGTKKIGYLEENIGAVNVSLSAEEEKEIRAKIEKMDIAGARAPL
ncbi:Aldo/keto reductase-like protein [Lasiosphaeria ovina]|uniref:Aldo/keto reductase-like protein n=1 Tax=Lasiosphaeria ovina TaxID=92902 RepID=A0AAE0KIP8_9PEZI|nr:Aldo/keto reductase-like protein [Lasiosphaeria ovina]